MSVLLLLRSAAAAPPPPPPPSTATGGITFPDTTLFPGAAVYPGQGTHPIARLRLSFDDVSVRTPTWTEVDHRKFRSFSVSRGRSDEFSDFDAGNAMIVLDNRNRAYDPTQNASVRPLNRVWLYEEFSGEVHDLFVGYVESWDQEWPGTGFSDAIATATCADEFKVLSLARLPTTSPPRDNYGQVIAFDNPSGYWTMGINDFNALSIEGNPGPSFVGIEEAAGPLDGWTNIGAVVGDESENVGMLEWSVGSLNQTGDSPAATSGELRPEDPLAMTSLDKFAVEFWINASGYPSTTETVIRGPWGVNYKFEIQVSSTGVLSAVVRNDSAVAFTVSGVTLLGGSGRDPANTAHVVLRLQNGVLILFQNGVQVGSASFSGRTSHITDVSSFWTGPLTIDPNTHADWRIHDANNTGSYWIDELAFYLNPLSDDRILAHYTAGASRGYRGSRSGERFNAVLDTVGSRAPRSISPGVRFVTPSYMVGQAPLDELRKAVSADNVDAAFFTSASGGMVFRDSFTVASQSSAVTIGDAASEVPYLALDVDYSESFLTNEWNVTRKNGTTQTASDSTSIGRYFKRSRSLTDVPVTGDSEAAAIAADLLARYKDPLLRVQQANFDTTDQESAAAFFRRELSDKITVKRTPPGGGSRISQDLLIQRIEVAGSNDGGPWLCSWSVAPV